MNIYSSSSETDSDNEYFIVRKRKIYKNRIDNFNMWTDYEFYQRFKLSKAAVTRLLEYINVRISSNTNRGGAIQPITKLLLTLRFYATGNIIMSVSDFFGVSVASGSRIIKEVSCVIASLRQEFIKMPEGREELQETALQFYNIARFPTCIGTIDCTHIKIISPGGDDAEIYRNRKGYFSLNIQTVSDRKLKIRNIVARWPGSVHDQTIFNNSILKRNFENARFGKYRLIGDSGYALTNYLFTPLQNVNNEAERLYNESLIRTRNTVERQYGVWKRRFPILAIGIKVNIETAMTIIVATAILHNFAIMMNETPFDDDSSEENNNNDEDNNFHSIENCRAQQTRSLFIQEHFTL